MGLGLALETILLPTHTRVHRRGLPSPPDRTVGLDSR